MILVDKILLLVLFLFGAIISYKDFKIHRIKNFWIVFGLMLGFLFLFSRQQVSDIFINFIISIIVGFILWKTRVWAAGDAKLFILFSFLLPLNFYSASYLPYFPSFALLLNIFIVVFIFLIIKSAIFYFKNYKEKEKFLKASSKKIFSSIFSNYNLFLSIYILIFIFSFYYHKFGSNLNMDIFTIQTLIFAILIIFSNYLSEFFKNNIIKRIILLLFFALLLGGIFLNYGLFIDIMVNSTLTILLYMIIFVLFKELIDLYIEKNETKTINVSKLEEGMVMNEKSVEKLKLINNISLHPRGLSIGQVDMIKQASAKLGVEEVSIICPFPFALWMFLGVIATILAQGSIINFFMELI